MRLIRQPELRAPTARAGGAPFRRRVLRAARAFTLMEVILALGVSAIVLAAIGGVFFSALRLRERTVALLDQSAPLHQALTILRRDLQGALPPGGVLAGNFLSGPAGGSGAALNFSLQFSTATGVIGQNEPWGDVQEVTYELRDPEVRTTGRGKDLVRSYSRNLLTSMVEFQDQVLLENVESIEFACYDGSTWRDSWDTSLSDTNLPAGVRVRLLLATDEPVDARSREPIEMVIPLAIQSRTNQVAQTTEATTP